MKCLAIADLFINKAMMDAGLNALRDKGIDVEVRYWSHFNSCNELNIKDLFSSTSTYCPSFQTHG